MTGLVPLPPPLPPDLPVDEGDDPPRVPVEPPVVPEGDWPEPVPVAVGPGMVFDVGLVTAAGGVYVLRNDSLDTLTCSRLRFDDRGSKRIPMSGETAGRAGTDGVVPFDPADDAERREVCPLSEIGL